MNQNLPTGYFQWVDTKVYGNKLPNKVLDNLPDNKEFVFEVDLENIQNIYMIYIMITLLLQKK